MKKIKNRYLGHQKINDYYYIICRIEHTYKDIILHSNNYKIV